MIKCACGKDLHYTSQTVKSFIEDMIELMGADIRITVGNQTWLVPRHYLALHGLKAMELPRLARELGFQEIEYDGKNPFILNGEETWDGKSPTN